MTEQRSAEEVVRGIFAATDAMDTERKLGFVTDDVSLTFGNAEEIAGRDGFAKASDDFNASLTAVRHEITGLWVVPDADGDRAFVELVVHYERLDGGTLSLPCFNSFRLRDGLISDYRIYMDINPVYA